MRPNGLTRSLRKLRSSESELSEMHTSLLTKIDSLELESAPVTLTQEYPSKFLIDISAFEDIADLANALQEHDSVLREQVSAVLESVADLNKVQAKVRSLKLHLFQVRERVKRDEKYMGSSIRRVSTILNNFRERCKSEFTEFLKSLDYDLRKVLKPLVPSAVIEENVKYAPLCQHDSLNSSMQSEAVEPDEEHKFDMSSTTDKLNNHINMLVNTLETVAKDLIHILGETDRKYFEFVSPQQIGTSPPTPLAAPLPEYFIFDSEEVPAQAAPVINEDSLRKFKEKVHELMQAGELSRPQGLQLQQRLEQLSLGSKCDLNSLFEESTIPTEKREDIVYKLISTGPIEELAESKPQGSVRYSFNRKPQHDSQRGVANERRPEKAYYSTPRTEKARRSRQKAVIQKSEKRLSKKAERQETASPFLSKQRKELRVRSITPVQTESNAQARESKTPIPRRYRHLIK